MTLTELDPQAAALLGELAEFEVGGTADIDAQRRTHKALLARITDPHRHRFDGAVSDTVLGVNGVSVPVRRYEPYQAKAGAGVVYFHGGGWMFGDLDTGERFACSMARTLGVAVISVDYRRAPEAAFPAALDDCVLAAEHAREEFDTWCALAGDSAGGNLALAACLAARPGREYDAQLLVYPCLDAAMAGPSYETFADGYGLTRDVMALYWKAYSGRHPSTNPLLSPYSAEFVGGLPPTLLVSAGYDVLYDENRAFAQRLVSADVRLTYLPFMSLPHGFIDLVDRVESARAAVRHVLTSFECFVPHRT